jgi:hypothetical protein
MEQLPTILALILVIVFGLLAIFVKPTRITSCIILVTALTNLWMMESYNLLAAQGETIGLLIMGSFNILAALTLLMFHDEPKAPEQAIVFILFAICNGLLAYDVFSAQFIFYEAYNWIIGGLTLAHLVLMGDYYEDLYKNFKNIWGNIGNSTRSSDSFNSAYSVEKLRDDGMGSSGGSGDNSGFASGTYDNRKEKA